MTIRAPWLAIFVCGLAGYPRPADAQVDQQRAQAFFKEAQALCEGDGGRLWGVSVCAPMVIGDARTQTFATSQPPPDAPRPRGVGFLNAPIQWGGVTWIAYAWDDLANAPPWRRTEILLHEMFHGVQRSSDSRWASWSDAPTAGYPVRLLARLFTAEVLLAAVGQLLDQVP